MIESTPAASAASGFLSGHESQDQAFLEQLNKERARLRETEGEVAPGQPYNKLLDSSRVSSKTGSADQYLRLACFEATGNVEGAQDLYAWVSGESK